MSTKDSNAMPVRAMRPGETRWVSFGAILRLRTRNARNQVEIVHDKVALSLAAIGTLVKQPNNSVRVTRDNREYKVHLDSGELDFINNLGGNVNDGGYAEARVVPR
jgi:hypothetical protein